MDGRGVNPSAAEGEPAVSDESYALLREPDSEIDVERASEILSLVCGRVRQDVMDLLRSSPGILIGGLSGDAAQTAIAEFKRAGMRVFAVRDSDMVILPRVTQVRQAQVREGGFRIISRRGAALCPWNEIIFFDSARVRYEKKVKRLETEPPRVMYYGRHGAAMSSYRVVRKTHRESDWHEYLDAVCYEPWTHFRILKEDFKYAATGLPMHPTREANFQALVVTFKVRCAKAREGPGIEHVFDGRPDIRARFPGIEAYENHILWQVQLLYRQT